MRGSFLFFKHKFFKHYFVSSSYFPVNAIAQKVVCPLPVAVAGSPSMDSDPSEANREMASVVLEFKSSAGDSEPQNRPVLVIGQLVNLQKVGWNQIKGKLQPGVSKEVLKMQPRSLLANSRPAEVNVRLAQLASAKTSLSI